MRRLTITALILAGIVAAAVVATPAIVSTRLGNLDVDARLGTWAGEQVTVHGEPEVTLFPSFGVEVKDVVVSGVPGAGREPFMTIQLVKASLNIVPLLVGRVEMSTLTLVDPHIQLDGRRASDVAGTAAEAGVLLSVIDDVGMDEIILRNGSITHNGQRGGDADSVTAINLRLARQGDSRTAGLSGTFEWRGVMLEIDAEADDAEAVFDGTGSDGRLRLAAAPARSSVDGNSDSVGQQGGGGQSEHSGQSLRYLVERLGIPIAPSTKFGPLLVAGTLKVGETSLTLSDATLAVGDDEADGDLSIRLGGDPPTLRGALVFEKLDLDSQLERPLRTSLRELFAAPLSTGWLSRADIDLSASARKVDLGGNQLTEASATLLARGGRAALILSEGKLAGGRVAGEVAIEPGPDSSSVRLSVCLKDVSAAQVIGLARPAAHDRLIGMDEPLRGTGTMALELAADGNTVEAFTKSISGMFVANVRDGYIGGIDVESTLERLVDGNTVIGGGNAPFIPVTGRTEFDSLSTYIAVDAGVAHGGGIRIYADRYHVSLSGGGHLTRGEIEAEGVASLFDSVTGEEQRYRQPLVQLPFGVGGTIRQPMIAPGIPRVGYGPHKSLETTPLAAQPDSAFATILSADFEESDWSGGESSGGVFTIPASATDDRVGAYRDVLARCEYGSVP